MADLTPAAQKVLDALYLTWDPKDPYNLRRCGAAALRALDEQLGYEVLRVRCVDSSMIQMIADQLDGVEVSP